MAHFVPSDLDLHNLPIIIHTDESVTLQERVSNHAQKGENIRIRKKSW